LLVGVFGASRRGFYANAIEGTRTPSARTLEINLRYNQNTIEQTILAAIAWLGLAVVMPQDQLYLIAGMAILFAVGRASFWIGYLVHPMARTFGMTLTVIPTIIAFAALTWRAAKLRAAGNGDGVAPSHLGDERRDWIAPVTRP
jgi:MAPEG family